MSKRKIIYISIVAIFVVTGGIIYFYIFQGPRHPVVLQNIDPAYSPMIRFMDKDFGPQDLQFDDKAKSWVAFYPIGGQDTGKQDEEFYFNFYLKGTYSSSTPSAKDIADSFAKSGNTDIIQRFSGPDPITNNTDYFIYSQIPDPQLNYTHIYITKFAPMNGGVFSVTYIKEITGSGADLGKNVINWFDQNSIPGGALPEIGNINISPSWVDYLSKKRR